MTGRPDPFRAGADARLERRLRGGLDLGALQRTPETIERAIERTEIRQAIGQLEGVMKTAAATIESLTRTLEILETNNTDTEIQEG